MRLIGGWGCTGRVERGEGHLAMASSMEALHSSRMTKKRSKRDMMGAEMSTLALRLLVRSYLRQGMTVPARWLAEARGSLWGDNTAV